MTTLVASRQPLELLSMNNQPERRTSKRLAGMGHTTRQTASERRIADNAAAVADYERDDDFEFIRKSKRPKTEGVEPTTKKAARARTGAKDRVAKGSAAPVDAIPEEQAPLPTTHKKPTRRKASLDASDDEPQLKVPKRATRRSARLSGDAGAEAPHTNGAPPKQSRRRDKSPRPAEEEPPSPPQERSVESAKIALPMSDTPIINRNKEMRKKGNTNRRSSLGSRGRRASSLIESGQSAIPHREVDTTHFFKHIEAEGLPEPRRMKQLLTWCGERALSEKPPLGTPNANAILGARAIQDQLLKDFASRSDFSDWFSRDDDTIPKAPVIQKPNPRNIELDEKMAILEQRIQRLQDEKKAWLAIRKQPPEQQPVPLFAENESSEIKLPEFDLLDPDETRIRGFLADKSTNFASLRSRTETRLRKLQASLEFQVDQLADNIHKIEQRVSVAGMEADRVLGRSALRLREREEREKRAAGTKDMPIMEVLRSLGNILPEGG
ncbi:hypothetical protein S40293_02966 [Stachybotrys chartarum IBT 40293]|nr:hypothetical protein S40293_02966 [Stachybotrys chartarum IBT 40293]